MKKEERRGFLRVDESVPLTYHKIESTAAKTTQTVDISGGGVKIILSEPIEKGAVVQLKLNLPNLLSPIFCVGKVMWCGKENISGVKKVICGIAFLDIHPQDRKSIVEYAFFQNYQFKVEEGVSILTTNLTKKYGKLRALDNVNLKIMPGEVFTLFGPNGAGKTTITRILSTLLSPTEGKVKIANYDLLSQKNKIRKCIGYMPQTPMLQDNLTARENLYFFARSILSEEKIADAVEEALAFAELSKRENSLFKTFSWGMRQRLSLAVTLLHKPKILFLDEPTAGMDLRLRMSFWEHFYRLSQNKVTVFITTHQLDEVDNCRRVAFLQAGKIVVDDTPSQIKKLRPTKVYIFCSDRNYTLKTTNYTEELPPFLHKEIKNTSKIKKIEIKEPHLSEIFCNLIEEMEISD